MWEETHTSMWKAPEDHDRQVEQAYIFTGNAEKYGRAMVRVINEWPISCEHNLTNMEQNRQAWIGHAACALELNLSERCVRSAWARLTINQRKEANLQADHAIRLWEQRHQQKSEWESTYTTLQNKEYLKHSTTSRKSVSALAQEKTVQLCFIW